MTLQPTPNKRKICEHHIQCEQGKRLQKLRKTKKLTADQLAVLMTDAGSKVSRGAISNWERGTNGIVSSKLPMLAQILGCSLDYILTGQTHALNSHDYASQNSSEEPSENQLDDLLHDTSNNSADSTSSNKPQRLNNTDSIHNQQTHTKNVQENTMTQPSSSDKNVLKKSDKLANVCYDIRGPLLKTAEKMEADGHKIIKLNVGNPAPFEFTAPQEIIQDVAMNLTKATGYCDSQGIFSARKAVLQYYQSKGLLSAVNVRDVYIGNGVSELIVMTMQAMLNNDDEILIPMPDYPLWTAAANLAGGKAVHYVCDEENNWEPNIEDIKAKITSHTKGIVVINPNNPTGAVYSNDLLLQIIAIAKEYNLVIMADEIYDRVLYDGIEHTPMSTLTEDVLVLSYNGLSKSHRIAGFRAGWLMLSGKKHHAQDFIEGLDMLASMRLCANVPAQYSIQTAMGGHQSMQDLTSKGGRLYKQRALAVDRLNSIKGVSCTLPSGAFYCFPRIDLNIYPIENDTNFMMELLIEEKVLIVQGTGFNWHKPDHFRVVFLPNLNQLEDAMQRLERFFERKRIQFGTN